MSERGVIFKDSYLSTPQRSWFDMSFSNNFSMNMGDLVPTLCQECMPGDVIHTKTDTFARLAPLVSPVFGKLNMFSYHFFVRNKDIWKNWYSFFVNADVKQPWQQQVNFVPPVMPYLDIREILYNSSMFVNNLYPSSHTPSAATFPLAYCNPKGVMYLYIAYTEQSDEWFCEVIDSNTGPVDYWQDSRYHGIMIQFIPNRSDLDKDHLSNYYNPFSNSTLFDYLGVDLSGMTDLNYSRFSGFINRFQNMASTQFLTYLLSDWFDTNVFDLKTWLRSHVITAVNFWDLDGNVVYLDLSTGHVTYDGSDISPLSDMDPMFFNDESSKINALPVRAYHFLYSEYFRDQNYVGVNKNVDFTRDGNDIDWSQTADVIFDYLTLDRKCWEHDPYTSALPGPQRGDAVRFLSDSKLYVSPIKDVPTGTRYRTGTSINIGESLSEVFTNAQNQTTIATTGGAQSSIMVDLSAATIENFRFANVTQRFYEKCARSGSRPFEYLLGIFGVDCPDAKLDRPIYLGGDKTPVQVSEVVQTSATNVDTGQPLGDLAGRAIAVGSDDYLEYTCLDSGFFIEVSSCIPRVSYQQGLAPMFTRKAQLDYPIPDFAQIGEEPVRVGELYYSADSSLDDTTFGFQSRYSQWKYNRDVCHGSFKDSMNHWTFARIFDDLPVAGQKFLEVDPDYRQFAVTDKNYDHLFVTMWHDIQMERALPVFGIPSL